MFNISNATLTQLRERYTKGTRVQCDAMNDPFENLEGISGTVKFVDDAGTVHVAWDNGSSLGLVYGVDSFHKI